MGSDQRGDVAVVDRVDAAGSAASAALVLVVDADGRIVHAGGATEELVGDSPRGLLLRPLDSLVHPADLPVLLAALSGARHLSDPVRIGPVRIATATATVPLHGHATSRRDRRGRARTVLQLSPATGAAPLDESALRRALRAGELDFDFQPVVDLDDGAVAGYEALLRWERPGVGRLGPGAFLGLADDPALVARLGRHVVRSACEELVAGDLPGLSINLSASELREPGLVHGFREVLDETGADPSRLVVEVAQRAVLAAPRAAATTIRTLRDELGLAVALDNTDTSAASTEMIRLLGVDVVKLDRPVVAAVAQHAAVGRAAVGIVDAARATGAAVVAEGIETQAQIDAVRAVGCQLGQGYHLGRPAPEPLSSAPR